MKKLGKILPKDDLRLFEADIEKEFKNAENQIGPILYKKQKEI